MSWSAPDGGWSSPPPRFDAHAQSAAYGQDQREVEFVEPNKPPLTWLLAGALLGAAQSAGELAEDPAATPEDPGPARTLI